MPSVPRTDLQSAMDEPAFRSRADALRASLMLPRFLDPRQRSLARGTMLVLGSLLAAFLLAHWPDDPPSFRLLTPALVSLVGTWETLRCLRARWSFYHGAVMVLLYMDIMAIAMILFLFLYPWGEWIK